MNISQVRTCLVRFNVKLDQRKDGVYMIKHRETNRVLGAINLKTSTMWSKTKGGKNSGYLNLGKVTSFARLKFNIQILLNLPLYNDEIEQLIVVNS